MIDHILGRPSVKFRKVQVLLVVAIWTTYLLRGNRHGPPGGRRISAFLTRRLSTWQTLVTTFLSFYVARNFGKLVGLECPEPLADLYTRPFFRATWVTTAMDAGFWSAMHIKRKSLRDFCSIVFTVFYLLCAEQADEKVRKVRSVLTVDHLRISWNKALTPYVNFATRLTRPRFMRYNPRAIRIPRPDSSSYAEPVHGWLYFDGPIAALKKHRKVILNIPGGGFVAMSPRTHDDSLMAWAGKTGLPVLSLDYRKAPEYPYPYAINECYDVYLTLVSSRGRCIGLSGDSAPQVVISGDSAGGNLAASLMLMILQTDARRWPRGHLDDEPSIPEPVGLVLIYPALDMNIGNWMSDEQMALIRDRDSRRTNAPLVSRKNSTYRSLDPSTPHVSDDEEDPPAPVSTAATTTLQTPTTPKPNPFKTRLAVPSLISYVSDRMLTPEMMRAMIILYIGPYTRPSFATDYLLSPVLAPDALLARFPPTYFLTGERDPLVDDTAIMAGRLRAAKKTAFIDRRDSGALPRAARWRADDHVVVSLVPGISHGFIQLGAVFPDAWRWIERVGRWYEECFERVERRAREEVLMLRGARSRRHARRGSASSVDEDEGLVMSMASGKGVRRDAAKGASAEGASAEGASAEVLGPDADDELGFARPTPVRRRSMVSLGSEDDLLGRRMRGIVGGLTRRREE